MWIRRLLTAMVALAGGALLSSCAPGEETGPVVLAAASMQEALEEVADRWEGRGHARPVISFAGTASLARQAELGAPADIFVSADEQWMDWLEERQLIDPASRRNIASNRLVFVWRDLHLELPTAGMSEVPHAARRIALADPDSIPAGRYAKQALDNAGVWEQVAGTVVPTENVRVALALVERGEADLGVVYSSDVQTSPNLLSAPLPLPEGVTILYPAALFGTSTHSEAAAFLDFLAGEEGAAILCSHGFTIPTGHPPC